MPNILIYNDEGTGARSLHQLVKSLKEHSASHPIQLIDRRHLTQTPWEQDTLCLIFPGGRDIPYHEALKGNANDRINGYVQQGGNYFGICAGAYYGCASILFEKNSPLEISADRELAFYPGKAIGPAYGNGYYYQDERGARIAHLKCCTKTTFSYFNGGCYFFHPEQHQNIKVIANYADISDEPAAIIECSVGKGKAILSGVHPEYSAKTINVSQDPYLQQLLPKLQAIEKERKELFTHLLDRLSI